jgi:hypothetical protein
MIGNRGAVRGVRLVAYDSVLDIRRAMGEGNTPKPASPAVSPALTVERPHFAASSSASA